MKKVIITGDREYRDKEVIRLALAECCDRYGMDFMVIHGACRGADLLAEEVCISMGVMYCGVPARWNIYGVPAGPVRNLKMLNMAPDAEMVLAFHDNIVNSKGTKNMIKASLKMGIMVKLHERGNVRIFNPKQLELAL